MSHQVTDVFNRQEAKVGADIGLRVDCFQPFRHGIGFGASVLAFESMELAVGVGHADVVHIHQSDGANATAGQGFGGPGPDTAQANNGNMGLPEGLQGPAPVESFDAAKANSVIVVVDEISGLVRAPARQLASAPL